MEITKDKVTELFCIIDEFYKVFDAENAGKLLLGEDGVKRRDWEMRSPNRDLAWDFPLSRTSFH